MKCKVIGNLEIAGVAPGGVVDLDPDTVNIPALIAGGHVEEIKSPSGAKTPDAAEKGSEKRTGARKGD